MNPLSVAEALSTTRKLRVGSCAWSFDDWRGVFFPEHMAVSHRLEFYAQYLDAVEIDASFYAAPSVHAASHWNEVTPEGFVFSAKMPREITHDRKLRHCEELLAAFLKGLEPIHAKMACVLVQLPPYFVQSHDETALRDFLRQLRAWPTWRFALEFRDVSWHVPRITHLLEAAGVCWVWNDLTPLNHSQEGAFEFLPRTTDFLYVRLLGDLATKYDADGERRHHYNRLLWPRDLSLESWAVRIKQHLAEVQRVLVMANNHFEGFAPRTAQRMAAQFGVDLHLPNAAERSGHGVVDKRQLELPGLDPLVGD